MPYARQNHSPASPGDPIVFQAEPFHYAVADGELIADLRKVALLLSSPTVFPQQYIKHGRFSTTLLRQRFGNWNAALRKARLRASHPRPVKNTAILRDIARVAKKIGSADLKRSDYVRKGRFGTTTIARRFGSWTAAKIAAGLAAVAPAPKNPTNDELLDNFEQLWRSLGRQPRGRDVALPHSRYDAGAYRRRFGTYRKALAAFINRQRRSGKTQAIHQPTEDAIHHKTPREVRAQLRYQVLRRDRFRCRSCGRSPANDPAVELQVDHIHPWCLGGETLPKNLQTLCAACNAGKAGSATTKKNKEKLGSADEQVVIFHF